MSRVIPVAVTLAFVLVMSCKGKSGGKHSHGSEHPTGHNHHEEGHGHGDIPNVSMTLWNDAYELFGEHPVGVAGTPCRYLLHLTSLQDFRALEEGKITLELKGPETLVGTSNQALGPGIFAIEIAPKQVGVYRGTLRIETDTVSTIEGLTLEVFADGVAAAKSKVDDEHQGVIEFLKEQQWGVPFGTQFAAKSNLVASVEVAGRIDTPPGGRAEVGAPVTGRVVAPTNGFPLPGSEVKKGDVLAMLMPAPSSPEDAARASLAVAEAQARASAAVAGLERSERLIRDEAISVKELEAAKREARVAREAVRAASRAAALYSGAAGNGRSGAWKLSSPIDGTLVSVDVTPGATVSPGEVLFRVVDTTELWIVARAPEQDAARLRTDRDAAFQVTGLDEWIDIDITGDDASASIVMVGKVVDARSRTVDVLYALHSPAPALRVGGLIQVSLPAGKEFSGIVIPRSALVTQEGRDMVYVQVDGEHFEERLVRVGPRSGTKVGIESGLQAGERLVTRGAHLVRLADRSKNTQAHGHVH